MGRLGVSRSSVGLSHAAEVAKAVLAVDVGCCQERAGERGGGAPRHPRTASGAHDVEDAKGIAGGEVDLDIARHRGDGLHGDLGRAESQEDGERVVDAGIGVDEDGRGQLTPRVRLRIIRGGGHHIEQRRIG
jgi:hypothetical protein